MSPTSILLLISFLSQSGRTEDLRVDLSGQESIPGYVLLPPPTQGQFYGREFPTVWTREDAQSAPTNQWLPQAEYPRHPSVQLDSRPFSAPSQHRQEQPLVLPGVPLVPHYTEEKPSFHGQQYLRDSPHSEFPSSPANHNHQPPQEVHNTKVQIPHGKLVLTLASDPNFQKPPNPPTDSSHQPISRPLEYEIKPKSLANLLAEKLARSENSRTEDFKQHETKDSVDNTDVVYREALDEYPEEIDHLYEEFVNMYYDDQDSEDYSSNGAITGSESPTEADSNFNVEVIETPEVKSKLEYIPSYVSSLDNIEHKSSPIPEFTTVKAYTSSEKPTQSVSTTKSPTTPPRTQTVTRASTSELQKAFSNRRVQSSKRSRNTSSQTVPRTTARTKPRVRPLSLSEVIQKMDVTLPSFLAAITKEGRSLKDVTHQLSLVQLTKTDFRKIRGDVSRLLQTLDASVSLENISTTEKPVVTQQPKSTTHAVKATQQEHITTERITTKTTPKTTQASTETTIVSTTSLKTTTWKQVSLSPQIFGSKPSDSIITLRKTPSKDSSSVSSRIPIQVSTSSNDGFLQGFEKLFNITSDMVPKTQNKKAKEKSSVSDWASVSPKPYMEAGEKHRITAEPERSTWRSYVNDRKLVNSRLSSTKRPNFRPAYVIPSSPKPGSTFFEDSEESQTEKPSQEHNEHSFNNPTHTRFEPNPHRPTQNIIDSRSKYKIAAHNADVATKSAILAAVILGSVALTVFIAIFIVVRYRSHRHKRKRRKHLSLHSDSSTSSIPPLYATRSSIYRSSYHSSGFWNSLKKKFDPYSISDSPTSLH